MPDGGRRSPRGPKPQLLVHSPGFGKDIAARLGRRNYSYHFVMQAFLPVLRTLGDVVLLDDPADADRYYDESRFSGVDTYLLVFAAPHETPARLRCPSLPIFAWEFDTIPTDPWGGEPRNDWREVLRQSPTAITHSEYAARATTLAMGPDFPVWSIPAPIHERATQNKVDGLPFADGRKFNLAVEGLVADSRTMGLNERHVADMPSVESRSTVLELEGLVYTTVLNPEDGRKNWEAILTAFVDAFRETPDATLVVKIVHHDASRALPLWDFMKRMVPYQCRLVLVSAYLDDDAYSDLIRATSYTVNASKGEGQCLPLMEFMSAGCPAIAPDHSAMAEYVSPANSFVVKSFRKWTHWAHDPRELLRTSYGVVEWDSLRQAYIDSYQEAVRTPERYAQRSSEAIAAQERYCSERVVSRQLATLLNSLAANRSDRAKSDPDLDATGTSGSA